ncbi:amidophosphoribosyltransferase [bacterium]|nr:amidophosphoribosyltransferase [bacterium]
MCGIIAISGTDSSAYEAFFGLMNLQHRGQDGAGILTVDEKEPPGFHVHKGSGLIDNVFSERSFKNLKGRAAVGHTRYATVGGNNPNLLQPFLDFDEGLGLAHNGNIVNFYSLKDKWLASAASRNRRVVSDSELILRLLADELRGEAPVAETFFKSLGSLMKTLVGAYSVVGLTKNGDIFGFRDPNGIRPLVFGTRDGEDGRPNFALASESVALRFLSYTNIEEIAPGEAIFVSADGQCQRRVIHRESASPCMFEWVYFARVESEFNSTSVYKSRFRLGLLLAEQLKQSNIEADIVVPVPETSRATAIALSESLNIPFRELLIKNRYVNRTFILDDQHSRQEAIRRKLFPIADEFEGQRCLVVDDSIVRGNTAQQLVRLIRQSGAKEIILVSACPPISHPCYYGIDFPSPKELIAYGRDAEAVAKELGADRVVYQSIEGLKKSLEEETLCTGCLTGSYPTSIEEGLDFEKQRLLDRKDRIKESSC